MMDAIPAGLDGRLFEAIIHWKDAKYLQDLSEDIKRGTQDVLTRFHGWINATPPTGYKTMSVEIGKRRDGSPHFVNKLIPDPNTSPLVQAGFEMAANQVSLSEILKATNLYHDVTGVARMLKNKIYVGIYEHSGLYIENFCPPIIERALFEKVQQIRDKARQRHGYYHPRAIKSNRYMLTGLIYCANCGHPLHGQRYHEWRYYICHNIPSRTAAGICSSAGIRADSIEKSVMDRLEEILNSTSILQQLFSENQKMSGKHNESFELSLQRKRDDLETIERQISRVVDAISKLPDSEALLGKLKDFEKEKNKVRQELELLEASKPLKIRLEDLNQLGTQLKARLEDANDRTKQLILRSLNTRVSAIRILTVRDSSQFTGDVEFDFGLKIKLPL